MPWFRSKKKKRKTKTPSPAKIRSKPARQLGKNEHLAVELIAKAIESTPGKIVGTLLAGIIATLLGWFGLSTAAVVQGTALTSPVLGSVIGAYISASDSGQNIRKKIANIFQYRDVDIYVDPFIEESVNNRVRFVKNVDELLPNTYFDRWKQAKRHLKNIIDLSNEVKRNNKEIERLGNYNRAHSNQHRNANIINRIERYNIKSTEKILKEIDTLKAIYWEFVGPYGKAKRKYGKSIKKKGCRS